MAMKSAAPDAYISINKYNALVENENNKMVSVTYLKQLNENKKASSFNEESKEEVKKAFGEHQVGDEHDDSAVELDSSDCDDNSSNYKSEEGDVVHEINKIKKVFYNEIDTNIW